MIFVIPGTNFASVTLSLLAVESISGPKSQTKYPPNSKSKNKVMETLDDVLGSFTIQGPESSTFKMFAHPPFFVADGSRFCNGCSFPHIEANAPSSRFRFDRPKYCSTECYLYSGRVTTAGHMTRVLQACMNRNSHIAVGNQLMRRCVAEGSVAINDVASLFPMVQSYIQDDLCQAEAWTTMVSTAPGMNAAAASLPAGLSTTAARVGAFIPPVVMERAALPPAPKRFRIRPKQIGLVSFWLRSSPQVVRSFHPFSPAMTWVYPKLSGPADLGSSQVDSTDTSDLGLTQVLCRPWDGMICCYVTAAFLTFLLALFHSLS